MGVLDSDCDSSGKTQGGIRESHQSYISATRCRQCRNRLAAAALLANGLPAQAQQTEVEALRAQIEELSQRLEKLESSQVAAAETAKATPPVSSRFPVTLSGLLQVHSLGFLNQEGPAPRANDTFRLRRGEIRITAPSITPRLSGTIMFDPAKAQFNRSASFWESGSNTIRARDAILQEIQLSYLLKKAAPGTQNNIYVDVGQYKIPVWLREPALFRCTSVGRACFDVHAARPLRRRLW
jgi:hypothetical protein